MATETTTPQTVNVQNAINNTESWLKQHERLIIVILLLAVGVFIAQKYFNISADIENHKYQVAQATLQAQQQKDDEALTQAKQLLATYQQALQQSQVQNTQLANAIAERDKALATQQTQDKQMTPSQLSSRWGQLIGDAGVQNTTTGFAVTQSAGLDTVQQLEQIPILKQNLTDEQTKETNLQDAVSKANDLISQGKVTVDGLQVQLQDQTKVCTAQVAAVQADARKSKLKWFGAGFVVGFVTGHIW